MPTIDIQPFATGGNANVLDQTDYVSLAARTAGFSSGTAQSNQVNKVLRQATFMAAALATFISQQATTDVLDDGDVAGVVAKMIAALQATTPTGGFATLTGLANEATIRANADAALGQQVTAESTARQTAINQAQANLQAEANARYAGDNSILGALANYTLLSAFGFGWNGSAGAISLPNGCIIQFGTHTSGSNGGVNETVTFLEQFPHFCLVTLASEGAASGWNQPPGPTVYGTDYRSVSSFTISSARITPSGVPQYQSGIYSHWLAIGY